METFFNAVLALWAIIAGVFKTPVANQPEGGVTTTLPATNFCEGDDVVTSLVKAGKTRRRRGNGDKTRAGNARALSVRTQRNAARKAASAAVAAKYGHRVVERVAKVRKSLVGKAYHEVVRSIAHLGGKTAKAHGSGKTAAQCRKNTYARKSVGGVSGGYSATRGNTRFHTNKGVIVKTPRNNGVVVTSAERATARHISWWNDKTTKRSNFHAWVAAQDGGWVSKTGAAKLAAQQERLASVKQSFKAVTGKEYAIAANTLQVAA